MTRNFKFTLLFTIALIVAFFLPWIKVFFFDASAFQIPRYVNNIQDMLQSAKDGASHRDYTAYLLYLIPVLCVLGICRDLFRLKIWYWDYIGTLLITASFMIYVLAKREDYPVSFGVGCYLTLGLSVCGLVCGMMLNGKKMQQDKSALFEELSNLQTLKEKGVLTEDIFESRRQELLQAIEAQEATK